MQTFKGRLLKQDQRVADIVPISLGMSGQNLFDARHELNSPASGLRGAICQLALSHVDGGSLPAHGRVVSAVPEQRVDLRLYSWPLLFRRAWSLHEREGPFKVKPGSIAPQDGLVRLPRPLGGRQPATEDGGGLCQGCRELGSALAGYGADFRVNTGPWSGPPTVTLGPRDPHPDTP